jgi:hypothetical protein
MPKFPTFYDLLVKMFPNASDDDIRALMESGSEADRHVAMARLHPEANGKGFRITHLPRASVH